MRVVFLLIFYLASFHSYADCAIGVKHGSRSWPYDTYGDSPKLCADGCQLHVDLLTMCFVSSMTCTGSFITTGVQCTTDGITPGGSFPPDDGGDGGGDDGGDGGSDNGNGDVPFPPMPQWPGHWDGFLDQLRTNLPFDEYLKARASFESATYAYRILRRLDELEREQLSDMRRGANAVSSLMTPMHENIADIRHKSLDIARYEQMNHGLLSRIDQNMNQLVRNTTPCIPSGFPPPPSGTNPPALPCLPDSNDSDRLISTIQSESFAKQNQDRTIGNMLNQTLYMVNNDLGEKLNSINDGLSTGDYIHRSPSSHVDFSALYQSSAIEELKAETQELEAQYDEKVQELKSLFSFDESRLNQGEYEDHSMTFTLFNGQSFGASSSVFPALIDVSHWIAAAIMFIAVLAGIRLLGD